MKRLHCILSVAALLGALAFTAFGAERGAFEAGAARVDITPAEGLALPMVGYPQRQQGFQGVHDKIFVRAIVISDGTSQAAIVSWDLIVVPDVIWARLSQRIAREAGIPVENLLLAAVHNHGAPTLAGGGMLPSNATDKSGTYSAQVEDASVRAVQQAKAKLQPARVGAGTGKAYVNINRRELTPDRGWWLGHNPDGPSDKTVSVVKFETASGKPIAMLINYAVHAVVLGWENLEITGDLAGATSRFVEQRYAGAPEYAPRADAGHQLRVRPEDAIDGDSFVALWTSGAAGDQNPISLSKTPDFALAAALGRILGEEAVRVANGIRTTPQARVWGAQQVVSCPGRKLEPGPRVRKEYKFEDSDPVSIRLSLLMINEIAFACVSGEVLTPVSLHLRAKSPFNRTIMVTNTNGSSGYIPDDAAFGQLSYEIGVSHLKPGCAEKAIVNGFLDMMQR